MRLVLCFRPLITGIDPVTIDLSTRGGVVNLYVRNIGFGRHVITLPIGMKYSNGNYSYVAQNCFVWWNGSMVTCSAPPGVSRGHRWTMSLGGVFGAPSASNIVTNYNGPVLFDIFSEFNNTITTPSNGSEVFNVTGDSFGPASENVLTWVRYSPVAHPNITFSANCKVIVDHVTLRCLTGPQAGNHLYWTVNVAGTLSEIPYTSTRLPNVTSVRVLYTGEGYTVSGAGVVTGAAPLRLAKAAHLANSTAYPSRSVDGLRMSTTGGGVVLLSGT